jgi:hypothetical protein
MPEGIFYVNDVDDSLRAVSGKQDRMRLGVQLTSVDASIKGKWFGHFGTAEDLLKAMKKYREAEEAGLKVHLDYERSNGYYNVMKVLDYDYHGQVPEVEPDHQGRSEDIPIQEFFMRAFDEYDKAMNRLFGEVVYDGNDRRAITALAIHLRMDRIKERKY